MARKMTIMAPSTSRRSTQKPPKIRCTKCDTEKSESNFYISRGKFSSQCKSCFYEQYRNSYKPKHSANDNERSCKHCGKVYRPKQRRVSVFCGTKCKGDARNLKAKAERIAEKRHSLRLCVVCKEPVPSSARSDKKYCSTKCAEDVRGKINNASRRLRTNTPDVRISRFEIYTRDEWTCQLCNKPVNRNLNWPHKLCASLDHILPLSRGGTNAVTNLQLAHYSCNSRRGDKMLVGAPRTGLLIEGKRYFRVGEAAEYLGCHYSVLRTAIERGAIPSSKLDNKPGSWSYIATSVVEQLVLTGIPGSQQWKKTQPKRTKTSSRKLCCRFCEREISVSIDLKSPRKYCSPTCLKQARKVRKFKEKKIVQCQICNQDMPLPDGKPTYLCSEKCRKVNRKNRHMKSVKKAIKVCVVCGKDFQLPRKPGHPPKTCSPSCASQWPAIKSRNHWIAKKKRSDK